MAINIEGLDQVPLHVLEELHEKVVEAMMGAQIPKGVKPSDLMANGWSEDDLCVLSTQLRYMTIANSLRKTMVHQVEGHGDVPFARCYVAIAEMAQVSAHNIARACRAAGKEVPAGYLENVANDVRHSRELLAQVEAKAQAEGGANVLH